MSVNWEIQFRELRKQFDEKSREHHRKCQQLHSKEGELLTKEREWEEASFEKEEWFAFWQQDLQSLIEENHRLREENKILEEIISAREKAPRKRTPRRVRKDPSFISLPFLDFELSNH